MEPQRSVIRGTVHRYESGRISPKPDLLTIEEPLEIRLGGQSLTVTMRTPGHDFELAAGFLYTEGVVRDLQEIEHITYCVDETQEYNVLGVELRPWVQPDLSRSARSFYAASGCGLCGKTSIEAVRARLPARSTQADQGPTLSAGLITDLPKRLATRQAGFARTGGLHAAALFEPDGGLVTLREDVGRHNAVDKVIGERFMARRSSLAESVLVLSGRAGFELVQKAAVAGIPAVVAIGAPSSLAVDLAREAGMTLVGFARSESFNIYSGAQRVTSLQ